MAYEYGMKQPQWSFELRLRELVADGEEFEQVYFDSNGEYVEVLATDGNGKYVKVVVSSSLLDFRGRENQRGVAESTYNELIWFNNNNGLPSELAEKVEANIEDPSSMVQSESRRVQPTFDEILAEFKKELGKLVEAGSDFDSVEVTNHPISNQFLMIYTFWGPPENRMFIANELQVEFLVAAYNGRGLKSLAEFELRGMVYTKEDELAATGRVAPEGGQSA